jgi:hypothetical protein
MDAASANLGQFTCASGWLVVCDSAPAPGFEAPQAGRDGSQCLHVAVQPGAYRVEYVHGEEGPGSPPARVLLLHETVTGAPPVLKRRLRLQVEGGRIAVLDRPKAADPTNCGDFVSEKPDAIQHGCGLVISTWGDGEYFVRLDCADGPAAVVSIVLEEADTTADPLEPIRLPGTSPEPGGLVGLLGKLFGTGRKGP